MDEIIEINKNEEQKRKVFGKKPQLKLISPCYIENGILILNEFSENKYLELFKNKIFSLCYFVPASGSGSRMFQFLEEFLIKPDIESIMKIERFFNNIKNFAFHHYIPDNLKIDSTKSSENFIEIIEYILKKNGLNYSELPKGLIPFHKIGPFILTPFQEHIVQANNIKNKNVSVHFTINKKFDDLIKSNIDKLLKFNDLYVNYSFSSQDFSTDSYIYDKNQENISENKKLVKKSSGHGALLPNLQKINDDIIFIKNIDNIQNYNNSEISLKYIQILSGILLEFRENMLRLCENPNIEFFNKLNNQYQLFKENIISNFSKDEIIKFANKPIRVCGMIKNEGQPGGGPFWVNHNGIISKQIIEKSQIEGDLNHLSLLAKSTHFNPVMIACCIKNLKNEQINLDNFADHSQYFVVEKMYNGKPIYFMELPGLWNGCMSYWNTIFVEIPSETFSPVKTVLDLLESAHLEK